jgi:hypothetical protein
LQDKAPYIAKANKLKAEYNKAIAAYNKGEVPNTCLHKAHAVPAFNGSLTTDHACCFLFRALLPPRRLLPRRKTKRSLTSPSLR